MVRSDKIRDFDEWYESKILLKEKQLGEDNKIRVLDDIHYDSETDEPFWHGIQFQRVAKSKKGRWVYRREKLNIPFDHFDEFLNLVLKVKEELGQIT